MVLLRRIMVNSAFSIAFAAIFMVSFPAALAFSPAAAPPLARSRNVTKHSSSSPSKNSLYAWFDNLFPQLDNAEMEEDRKRQFPEQYPACYELSTIQVPCDDQDAALVRPLLKQTQLETRPLQLAYDASQHGWSAESFHAHVDTKGAAIVLATANNNKIVIGGYNPKGFASMGGARPSVAAFLYYQNDSGTFQKLQKVGGGGLACGRDDPNYGICFGPDALVIGLQPGQEQYASSKLGPYFERGPEERSSLFERSNQVVRLDSLKVYVGKYQAGEEIPYSGAVMDMTSG